MSESSYKGHIPVKDEIYLISLVLADLTGVSITDFVERAITREALSALEAHHKSSSQN